ncbi:MAG TPA: hypothetical protein VMS60_10195 [Solirubrobacterales bacterium]|nr:hypothetical protein [Solirubrobacterales bacterium]
MAETVALPRRGSIISPAIMPDVFWIGLTIAVAIFLTGVICGARSRTTSLLTGATIGAYLGVMLAFPLLAIGLATS